MKHKYVVRPETAVLTRGFDPQLSVGSARPAVFRSSTYVFSSPESAARAFEIALGKTNPIPGEDIDLIYARISHPNAEILEAQMLPLEPEATGAAVFNSGMAAISTTLFTFCPPGTSLVHSFPLYGGTQMFLDLILSQHGVNIVSVPSGDSQALANAIATTPNLTMVFIETPANPTLRMTDISAVVAAASKLEHRPLIAVDNTFMGPVFQHPLTFGADLVLYSATKYLGGFSDLLGGMILAKNADLTNHLRSPRAVLGNILQPDECWLLNTRLVTVPLRMNRQSKNAQYVAENLVGHPALERVYYPSLLEEGEQKQIYQTQCEHPGAVISLNIKGGRPGAFAFLRALTIARNAVSLGGVESLACHPRSTTHSELTPEQLNEAGISEGLVRLSIGVENWRDLLQDFRAALDQVPLKE